MKPNRSVVILALTIIGFFFIVEIPSLWTIFIGKLPKPEQIRDTNRAVKPINFLTGDDWIQIRELCLRTAPKLRMELCGRLPLN